MNKRTLCAIAFALVALAATPAHSDATPGLPEFAMSRALSPSDRGATDVVDLRRVPGVRDFGPMAQNRPIAIGLLMRLRHADQLAALTLAQSNPHSPYFHRYLTPTQFTNYFAADAGTYARTIATLRRRGFRITQTLSNRTAIQAIAPAGIVGRYFHTSLHQVFQSGIRDGYRHVNVTPAFVPSELRDAIASVSGLHSIRTVRFPIRFAAFHATAASRKRAATIAHRAAATPSPNPASTSTPSVAQPGPDATIMPNSVLVDYATYESYGPGEFANAYDFPVQHGYGGKNQIVASVIDSDYQDSDASLEFKTFNIPRTGGTGQRFCADPDGGTTCDNTIGQPDPEGEASLDAETMLSLAPAAQFYTFIAPAFDDVQIEAAYEDLVAQDYVGVVSSSFGECETLDPDAEYSTNLIAMEGASLGISFGASTGDTGAGGCGLYAGNGTPETEDNVYQPAADDYFVGVGGTDFLPLTTCTGTGSSCYTKEDGWTFGGGGYSVLEPLPSWQMTAVASQAVVADTSTLGRNIPDLSFTADPNPPGVSQVIFLNGTAMGVGGTSLASPMWAAMQTEINQVQHSRNGWIVPALYAVWYAQNCASTSPCVPTTSFSFRNIAGGTNGKYLAVAGYNDSVGLGSPLGWELANTEYGTPGATAAPIMTPTPLPPGASPTPVPTPTALVTPFPMGTNFAVTTIAGSGCPAGLPDAMASMAPVNPGNNACVDGPTGVLYVASSALGEDTQSTTDNYLFVNDFGSGYLRAIDLTAAGTPVYTMEDRKWNNAVRTAATMPSSNLYGLSLIAESQPLNAGLIVASGGDGRLYSVPLPTTPDPAATPAPNFEGVGKVAASFENAAGIELGVVNAANGNFNDEVLTDTGYVNETFTTGLPAGGNFGLTQDGSAPLPNWVIADSGKNSVVTVNDNVAAATVTALASGAPLNLPKEITYVSATSAFYVANCGGNNIVRISSTGAMTVVAGDGAARELDGKNTGAEFDCPFGITSDGTNLYVTDLGGNAVRMITGVI